MVLTTLVARSILIYRFLIYLRARGGVVEVDVLHPYVVRVVNYRGIGPYFFIRARGLLVCRSLHESSVVLWFRRRVTFSGGVLVAGDYYLYVLVRTSLGVSNGLAYGTNAWNGGPFVMLFWCHGVCSQFVVRSFYGALKRGFRRVYVALVVLYRGGRIMVSIFTTSYFAIGSKAKDCVCLASRGEVSSLNPYYTVGVGRAMRSSVVYSHHAIRTGFFSANCVFFCLVKAVRRAMFYVSIGVYGLRLCFSPILVSTVLSRRVFVGLARSNGSRTSVTGDGGR